MPNVDERVVQMTFNNKQFEQGVSESLKTIEDLKNALDFNKAEKSLSSIEKAFNGVDFSGMERAIDSIADKFSPLGILGVTAMQRISNAAIDAGRKVADAFLGFSDMSAGQSKYETQTKAVQTIVNATGKTVEDVEGVLEKLQHYTDETSYDFAEMVSSIGKFTSVGVELERAEEAMEGISNWAAKAGAGKMEANRAMYNLSQALSTGSVKLIDWKSIQNANMATKEFKETAIQTAIELGVLKKQGEGIGSIVTTNQKQLEAGEKALKKASAATKDRAEKMAEAQKKIDEATKETTVDYKTFESTLSDGWFTSDVLIATLEKYSDTTTDFGKSAYYAAQKALTWSDALDAVKDAVSSGWMDSYKLIFGNLDEAMELWTNVANALVEYTDIFTSWRNEVLKAWHEQGGYNDMIETASNLWQTFMNIVQGVGRALARVFPILQTENATNFLLDATKKLKDASAELLNMFGLYEEITEEEEKTEDKAEDIADATEEIADNTQKVVDNMSDLSDEAKKTAKAFDGVEAGLKKGVRSESVKQMQEELMKYGIRLDKYGADGIFGPETEGAVKELQRTIGVPETGMFDEMTMAALQTDEAIAKLQERAAKGFGLGATGKDVKKVQEELNKYLGANEKLVVDGIFGPKTESKLKELQKQLGVEQTGAWDEATQAAVRSGKIILANVDKINHALETGSKGEEVKALQEELIKLGYMTDGAVADGIYGPETAAAVARWQRELGVEETGIWDHATYLAVLRAKRIRKALDDASDASEEASDQVEKAAEENEEAAEKADTATKYTSIAMMRLQNIVNGWASVMKIAANFGGALVKIGTNILSMFKPLIDVGVRFGSVFGVMFDNLAKDLEQGDIYGKFVDKVTKAFGPFGTLIENVAKSLNTFLDAYDAFLESTGNKNTFNNFFTFLGSYLKRNKVFATIIKLFDSIKKAVGSAVDFIKKKISAIFGWLSGDEFKKGKDTVFSWIAEQFENIKNFWTNLTSGGGQDLSGLTSFFNKVKSVFKDIKEFWFGNNAIGSNKKVGMFSRLGALISGDVAGFKEGLDENTLNTLSNIVSTIRSVFGKIGGALSRLFTGKGGEAFLELGTLNTIDNVRKGLHGIINAIKLLFVGNNDEKRNLTDSEKAVLEFRNKIIALFGKVRDAFNTVWNGIKDFVQNLDFSSMENFMGSLKTAFENIKKSISEFFNNAGSGIKDSTEKVADSASILLIWGVVIGGIIYVIYRVYKIIKGLLGVITNFSEYLAKSTKNEVQPLSDKILKFAAAIALIAGAIYLMSKLKAGEFWKGVGYIATILGVLTVFMVLARIIGKGEAGEAISKISDAILKVVIAIGILSAVIWLLSKFDPDAFVTGFTYLSTILGLIVVFSAVMALVNKIGKASADGKGIRSLAFSILILTYVIKILSRMKFEQFISGIIKLTAIMGLIVIFMIALSLVNRIGGNISIKGLLPITGAIIILTGVVSLLGILPIGVFIKGIMGLTVIMGLLLAFALVLSIVSRVMGGTKVSGLLGIAGVILIMAVIVGLLGTLPLSALAKGLIGLTAIMVLLSAFMITMRIFSKGNAKGMLGIIPVLISITIMAAVFVTMAILLKKVGFDAVAKALLGLVFVTGALKSVYKSMAKNKANFKQMIGMLVSAIILAGLMVAFSYSLKEIKDVSASQIISFATGLSEVMIAFSVAGGIAGKIGAVKTFLGILSIFAAITVVIFAAAAILKIPGVDEFLSGGAEKLGKIVGGFIGAMKAAEISAFNKATADMQSINGVDQNKVNNAIAAAKAVANFGAGLPEKSLIKQAADRIFGSELTQFATSMSNFGIGFNSFAESINSITALENPEDFEKKSNAAISIARSIRNFGNTLPEKSLMEIAVERIFGSELSQFATSMSNFGIGFNSFAESINSVEELDNPEDFTNKTNTAIAIASSIKTFGDSLKDKTIDQTIIDAIFGSKLSQFSSDMGDFGAGFNAYATSMNGVTALEDPTELTNRTDTAITIAESIRSFGNSLKEQTIEQQLVNKITGSPLANFSGDMSRFASCFSTYATTIGAIKVNLLDVSLKTALALSIAKQIKIFADGLNDKSGEEQITDALFGSKFRNFTGDMTNFATKFNKYAKTMGGITATEEEVTSRTTLAINIASQIAGFLSVLTDLDIETKATGLKAWVGSNETKGETVIGTIGRLASSIANSSDDFKSIEDVNLVKNVRNAMTALMSVASFLNYLSADNFNISAVDSTTIGLTDRLDIFLADLNSIAYYVKQFGDMTKDVDLNAVASVLQSISDLMVIFTTVGGSFNEEMVSRLDSEGFVASISEFIHRVSGVVEENSDSISDIGKKMADTILSGFVFSNDNMLSSFVYSVTSSLNGKTSEFNDVGKNFASGLAYGVYFKAYFAIESAKYIASEMVKAVKNIFQTASPSKVMMQVGEYFSQGLAKGTEQEGISAVRSSRDVAEGMVEAAKKTLQPLSSYLFDDVDDNPVIRPVVDMSNVERARGEMRRGIDTQNRVSVSFKLANNAANEYAGTRTGRRNESDYDDDYGSGPNLRKALAMSENSRYSGGDNPNISLLGDLYNKLDKMVTSMGDMKIILDTGELVGATSSAYDRQFGKMTGRRERGN